jgi:hypothetical protein
MFASLGGVLNAQNDDLVRRLIDRVVKEVAVPPGYELAYSLGLLAPPDLREQEQEFEAVVDGGSDPTRGAGVVAAQIVGDLLRFAVARGVKRSFTGQSGERPL